MLPEELLKYSSSKSNTFEVAEGKMHLMTYHSNMFFKLKTQRYYYGTEGYRKGYHCEPFPTLYPDLRIHCNIKYYRFF
jgi:hypothetical protein